MITLQDKQMLSLRECLDSLSEWVSYLDAISLGKTPDFERALSGMTSLLFDAKKILNSAKVFLPLT